MLYRAVVERMREGHTYYASMRSELPPRGYPTASIFNWRAPGTLILMSMAPRAVHGVMLSLGGLAVLLTVFVFRSAPPLITIAAITLLLGAAALPFVPTDGLYLPELWAGLFLLLSVLAYTLRAVRLAVCFAVAAIFARELAIPYVAASLALALRERRSEEVWWYVIGIALFGLYYSAHVIAALSYIEPGDMAHTRSWIAFGGWPFVVTTVNMGGWYMMLPRWTAAVGATILLACLWSPADRHLKLMVAIYLVGFSIVGQPFNNSWGLLTGPTWGLATTYGLIGLYRLLRSGLSATPQELTQVVV